MHAGDVTYVSPDNLALTATVADIVRNTPSRVAVLRFTQAAHRANTRLGSGRIRLRRSEAHELRNQLTRRVKRTWRLLGISSTLLQNVRHLWRRHASETPSPLSSVYSSRAG